MSAFETFTVTALLAMFVSLVLLWLRSCTLKDRIEVHRIHMANIRESIYRINDRLTQDYKDIRQLQRELQTLTRQARPIIEAHGLEFLKQLVDDLDKTHTAKEGKC